MRKGSVFPPPGAATVPPRGLGRVHPVALWPSYRSADFDLGSPEHVLPRELPDEQVMEMAGHRTAREENVRQGSSMPERVVRVVLALGLTLAPGCLRAGSALPSALTGVLTALLDPRTPFPVLTR